MADEERPTKKVVKRVVKKSVARPVSSTPAPKAIRYGRPVSTTTKPRATAASRPGGKVATPQTRKRPARPQVGAKVGAAGKAVASRGSVVASGVAGGVGTAGSATGAFLAGRYRAARAWRIPHLEPRLSSVITGLVVGLVSVGLALVALRIFSEVRGVSSGGGRWGSLTFVVVAFVAFALGELLLSAFGTPQARLTSFLGVVLTIVAILGLFVGLADSRWGLVLVPALGAVTYLASQWLLALAESSPTISE